VKAKRGTCCDFPKCKASATFWSGGFSFSFWEADLQDYGKQKVGYRCELHCDPSKWFPLEEEDYE
jgi:hypothetical protein